MLKYILILIVVIFFIILNNQFIYVNKKIYRNTKVPTNFEGYRIVQVSDIHGDLPKWKLKQLITKTQNCNPDIVFITGDLIDNIHIKKMNRVLEYIDSICSQYPVYYVTGNHEYMHEQCFVILEELSKRNIDILHNEAKLIFRGNECIEIIGVDDPYSLYKDKLPKKYKTPINEYKHLLNSIKPKNSIFSILLSHRPEFFESYVENKYDLVFSGHAHGGQWRIPFMVHGVIAPDQGLFPRYSGGVYKKNKTTMYVSRGLGNSVIPLRVFNLPELLEIILYKER